MEVVEQTRLTRGWRPRLPGVVMMDWWSKLDSTEDGFGSVPDSDFRLGVGYKVITTLFILQPNPSAKQKLVT